MTYTRIKFRLTAAEVDEEEKSEITWNFTKFPVGGDGAVVARFSPMATPEEIGEKLVDCCSRRCCTDHQEIIMVKKIEWYYHRPG